jgi:hypothetical protein
MFIFQYLFSDIMQIQKKFSWTNIFGKSSDANIFDSTNKSSNTNSTSRFDSIGRSEKIIFDI